MLEVREILKKDICTLISPEMLGESLTKQRWIAVQIKNNNPRFEEIHLQIISIRREPLEKIGKFRWVFKANAKLTAIPPVVYVPIRGMLITDGERVQAKPEFLKCDMRRAFWEESHSYCS